MSGRPRTPIGTFGVINVRRRGQVATAETRYRDPDGRLRRVTASGPSAAAARRELQQRLLVRVMDSRGGGLGPNSGFDRLADAWLEDLELRDIAERTKELYRDQLRLHIRPALKHYALAEITTGRVEWFLKTRAAASPGQARHARTVLNLIFGFALRHDAIRRNPVEGTSQLRGGRKTPQALTPAQIGKLRQAAAAWRTEPGLPGPKSDGQVRDIIEILLGTAMRPGEVLALRPCDVTDGPDGMVVHVNGTVVARRGEPGYRQDHPKTHASVRGIAVPEFVAEVLRRRLSVLGPSQSERTIFACRNGGPLTPHNVRRTFREFVKLAGLEETGISLRWYRRTGATVIARSMGKEAAATFLGHTSSVITEGHYIEPDPTIDRRPAAHLDRVLRPDAPDTAVLARAATPAEAVTLAVLDGEGDD